jgi:hypothetical protein
VRNLFRRPADGTGSAERLTNSGRDQVVESLSPDGKWLVYREVDLKNGSDLSLASMEDTRSTQPLLHFAVQRIEYRYFIQWSVGGLPVQRVGAG